MQPQRKRWRSRHKVLAAILFFGGGLVLLIVVLSVVAALQGKGTGSSCTSNSCIASEIQRSLVGIVAKDESVITQASCDASTVTENAGNTWTATCTVTYSDGQVWSGDGNLIPSRNEVTFEPQAIIRQ